MTNRGPESEAGKFILRTVKPCDQHGQIAQIGIRKARHCDLMEQARHLGHAAVGLHNTFIAVGRCHADKFVLACTHDQDFRRFQPNWPPDETVKINRRRRVVELKQPALPAASGPKLGCGRGSASRSESAEHHSSVHGIPPLQIIPIMLYWSSQKTKFG